MKQEFSPAIAALERRLIDTERKATELRHAINVLCEEAGIPLKYPTGSGPSKDGELSSAAISQIKPDTFYGKKLTTAMREFLEMRRVQGNGPASPREIFEALKSGGYVFGTKNDHVAMVGLRAMLRKNTSVFHRLPNSGNYGLLSWYPNARPVRSASQGEEVEEGEDTSNADTAADDAPAAA